MRPFLFRRPFQCPVRFASLPSFRLPPATSPSNVLSHYPPSLPHHFVTQPHLIHCQSSLLHHFIPHPSAPSLPTSSLQRSISSLHSVPIKRFRWNQMHSQTYLVPSKTFSRNQMPVPMGFVPCKTFSRNEIENTRFHQQAICRPEKRLAPIRVCSCWTNTKSPEEKSPGLCDPNRIQTYNLLIRSQMLYSIELWDQFRV